MLKQYELLEKVLADIEANIKDVNPVSLSHKYCLSEVHLRRLFRYAFRQPISTYIRSRRLTASLNELLKTDAKILSIALDYGFEFEQSYIRTFKKEFGITPGAARKPGQTVQTKPPFQLFHINKLGESILIGNIIKPEYMSGPYFRLIKTHCDIVTPENALKPEYIAPAAKGGDYRWNTPQKPGSSGADHMVDSMIENNIKVHGHVLVWHEQTPPWMWEGSKEDVKANMIQYIQDVLGHFKGRVQSWDVVNEAVRNYLPSVGDWKQALSMDDNPWYAALGADYIELAYRAARRADPDITLYYNERGLDDQTKAEVVCRMIQDINSKYKAEGNTRNLIEGIGIESHYFPYNLNVEGIENTEKTIEKFIDIGVEIAISELDISMVDFDPIYNVDKSSLLPNTDAQVQANMYVSLFKLYRKYKQHIKRVSLWGLDDKTSWQSKGNPCLFDKNLNPKKAFFSIMEYLSD